MILAMDILRWVTLQALLGQTWAEQRVYDSPAEPVDVRIKEEQAPYISVYTDDADVTFIDPVNNVTYNIGSAPADVWLVIEVAVNEPITVEDPRENQLTDSDADSTLPAIGLAATDQGMEATIGFISRQVNQALLATDNPWADLWRTLAKPTEVQVRRGGSAQQEQGRPYIRFASRVMRYKCEVLMDPVYGAGLGDSDSFWSKLIALMLTRPDLTGLAELIRDHFVTPATLPSWRIAQKQLALTDEGIRGLFHTPQILPGLIPDETEAPESTRGSVFDLGTGQTTTTEPEPPTVPPEPFPIDNLDQ